MVCAPVRLIIPSLKLRDYLSVQAHKRMVCGPVRSIIPAKVWGLSRHTGAQTMLYLSHGIVDRKRTAYTFAVLMKFKLF